MSTTKDATQESVANKVKIWIQDSGPLVQDGNGQKNSLSERPGSELGQLHDDLVQAFMKGNALFEESRTRTPSGEEGESVLKGILENRDRLALAIARVSVELHLKEKS